MITTFKSAAAYAVFAIAVGIGHDWRGLGGVAIGLFVGVSILALGWFEHGEGRREGYDEAMEDNGWISEEKARTMTPEGARSGTASSGGGGPQLRVRLWVYRPSKVELMPSSSNPPRVHIGIHIVVDSAQIGENASPKLNPNGELSIVLAQSAILVVKNPEAYHALRTQLAAFLEAGDKVFHQRDAFDEVDAKERSNWATYGTRTDPTKSHPGPRQRAGLTPEERTVANRAIMARRAAQHNNRVQREAARNGFERDLNGR